VVAKFVMIGSGYAGGLLAAYLGRRGYEVDVYERRADPREGNIIGGRSINLAISTRGIHALEQIGIADEALCHAIPMRGRMIHDKSGALHFSPYDVDPKNCINSIGRAALNTTVIETAQRYPNVRVYFNHKCTDVDLDSATAHLETSFVAAGSPQDESVRMADVSPANSENQIISAHADAVPLMPTLLEDFRQNPTGSLVTIRCSPWYYKDKVALVGDAAHAVVPFYGQGMNAAFEDCVVLDECLEEFPEDRERAFGEYFSRRKVNADALADLAIGNFIEMRDKTASKTFRAKKKLDHFLEAALPGIYLPLYTMVTFTRIPYAEAARRARLQDRIVYGSLAFFVMIAALVIIRLIS